MPRTCCECGSEVPDSSRQGFCPKCLLKLADQHTDTEASSAASDDFPVQLPRSFGSYELVALLGEGGMGMVFKATQRNLNRTVALKMLRSGLLASKDERQRFRAEAQAVGRLKHPNIVTVHETGEHEGRLFFSMDCIQGRSLAEIVGRTPLPPAHAARYTMQIAEAVHYAHTNGVLHRDLKPANVLVDEQDKPHITDFGLAKEISGDVEMTHSGAVLGTPSYMSPEQAAGQRKRVNTASDIYSIGAILYDLLTGRPPFGADSPGETLRQVIDQEPAPIRMLNVKVPRDLETICLKCLAKDPAGRYPSAQSLAEDLERFLRGEPILARRADLAERAYRWAKRYPAVAALQLAGVLMLGLVGYVAHYSYADTRESVQAAPGLGTGLAYVFQVIGDHVRQVASHSNLVESVRTHTLGPPPTDWTLQTNRQKNDLLKCLDEVLEDRPEAASVRSFENWLLLDTNGAVRANWTSDDKARLLTESLAFRDYFEGVTNLLDRNYHVSKGYKSRSDDRYKVAVIAPIFDNGQFLGALARMIAYRDLAHETARTKNVVIAEMDPDPSQLVAGLSNKYAVIWHPGLEEKRVEPIPNDSDLREVIDRVRDTAKAETIPRYEDPAGPGLWVARLAPVPGTHLFEVYQVRDRVTEATIAGAILFVLWAVGLIVWWIHRRRQGCLRTSAL